jgi:hypothetical protein
LIRCPEILQRSWILKTRLLQDKIIIYELPGRAPRGAPDRDITSEVIEGVSLEDRHDFHHRCPEGRFGSSGVWAPNTGLREIFGFQYEMQVAIGLFGNSPGRRKDETVIYGPQISNP